MQVRRTEITTQVDRDDAWLSRSISRDGRAVDYSGLSLRPLV